MEQEPKKVVEESSSFFLDEENLSVLFDFVGVALEVALTIISCVAEASDS